MMIAGSMTMRIYNSEIHEIYHDLGYWIINRLIGIQIKNTQRNKR